MDYNNQKPTGSYISYFSNLVKEKEGINLAQGIPGFQSFAKLLQSLEKTINENVHQYPPGIGNHTNWVRINIARPMAEIEKAGQLITQFCTKIT